MNATKNRRSSQLASAMAVTTLLALGQPLLTTAEDRLGVREEHPLYTATGAFSAEGKPHFPGINTKTHRLYVTDGEAGALLVFDVNQGTKITKIATGAGAHTVMVDEENNLIYVTNKGANSLSVIDGESNQKVADIPVGKGPHGLALDLSHDRAYISNTLSHNVTVVDTSNRKVIKTIATGAGPWGVALDQVNDWLYTSNTNEGTVSRIDMETGKTLAKITVGGRPWNLKVSKETQAVYVTNESTVSVLVDDKVVVTISEVGKGLHGIILDEERQLAFVAATASNQIAVIDTKENKVIQTLSVPAGPTAFAGDHQKNVFYVAHQEDNVITVLKKQEKPEDQLIVISANTWRH